MNKQTEQKLIEFLTKIKNNVYSTDNFKNEADELLKELQKPHYRVVAKRWFSSTYGNTYHSVRLYQEYETHRKELVYIPFQYGYGEQWQETLLYWIERHLPEEMHIKRYENGSKSEHFREWAERNNVEYSCVDVDRKRDL